MATRAIRGRGGCRVVDSTSRGVGVVRRLVVVRDPVLDVVVVETRVEDGCGSTRGGFVSSSATVRVRERVAHLVHPPRDGIAEASFSRSVDAIAAASVRVGVESETPAATRVAIVVARESRFGLSARVALRRGLVASHDARFREADHAVGGHRLEHQPLVAVHLRVTLAGVLAGAAIQIRRGVRVQVGVPPVFPLVVRILDAFEGLDLEPVQVHLATLVRGDDDANQLRRRRESERLVRPREKIRVDRVQPLRRARVVCARETA